MVECLTVGRGGTHANIILEGTDNPDMLKWAESVIQTGFAPDMAVHLCPANCPKAPVSSGGLHGQSVSREDKGIAWYGNVASIQRVGLQGELEKELADIPEAAGVGGLGEEKHEEDDANRKTAGATYKGSPLDKGTTVRWWMRTRRKKKKKKKSKKARKGSRKKSSSNSQSSTSDRSQGTISSQDSSHPFREGHRIKQLAKRIPGILTRHAIEEVERLLSQNIGDNQTGGWFPSCCATRGSMC